MSKIEKLSILGVRSFDPVNRETLQFHTPLTLIVGFNGSGKTTIIECLKYATTGELPPNSKGGAFIHDPKLCGEKEVLAQVKLSFRSTAGEPCVVTRNLQLTVKKTTRSQKTLEGTLTWRSNGERNSSSSRVNDLDTIVPEKLGVSQAILDAVIFTHQDESLWPMSEPSVLKKRFDEIFEAQRYTKAIDNLKTLKKTYGTKHGELKIQDAHDKQMKDKAEGKQRQMSALSDEIDGLGKQAVELDVEMKEAQAKSTEKEKEASAVLSFVTDLMNKKQQLQFRQDTINELRVGIDELPESDAVLQDALAQYEDRVTRLQEEANKSVADWKQLGDDIAASRKAQQAKLAEQGKHLSDKEKFEHQQAIRLGKIKEAAQRHAIRGYGGDLSDQQVQEFYSRFNKLLQDTRKDLQRIQQENGEEVDKLSSDVQAVEGRKLSRAQERSAAKKRMELIDKDIARRNSTIASYNIDEGSRVVQTSRLEELDIRLAKARTEVDNVDTENELQAEHGVLARLEAEGEKLAQEMLECNRLASERAQLDVRKGELAVKRRELDTLVSTWTEKISGILGAPWTPATVEAEHQVVLKRQQRSVEDANTRRETVQGGMKQVEFKLAAARDKRKKASEEDARGRAAVKKALDGAGKSKLVEDYPEVLESLEDDVAACAQDIALFDHLKEYYGKCQKVLREKDTCWLCERSFGASQAQQKSWLAKRLLGLIDEKTKKKVEQDLEVGERTLDSLKAVRPQYDSYQRARSEIPSIDKEIKALEAEKEVLLHQLEQLDSIYREVDDKRQDVEGMGKTVSTISQRVKDIADLEGQIARSTSQLGQGGLLRGVEEINEQQNATKDQIKTAKEKVKKLESDKRRKQEILNSLTVEQMELKNKVQQAGQLLAQKEALLEEIQQLKNEYSHQREIIQQIDKDGETLELEISKARAIKDDAVQRGRAKESKAAEERDGLAETVNQLKLIEDAIQQYVESGSAAKMAANEQSIKALELSIANTDKDIQDVTVRINKMKSEIADSDRRKKNIGDNIKLRNNARMVQELQAEIEQLEHRNDQADHARLMKERDAYNNRHSKLAAKYHTLVGQMHSKDHELTGIIAEFDLEYRDAAKKYRETHIKKETTSAIIADLAQYSGALDKAVMQYHSLKLAEVNRIAGELWQSTYQGTDIDTILIRSDADTTAAAASASGRRNYNYRVCMVKQDTEMDMRGRCSAGQKVLASIIIRLALAESFGINCGLIALDEPTTNLDSDNIRSLAESLHRIIRARQAQSNFQLIVITHDEEFLRHMQCSDFCDTFYRVRRDEKQCSIVRGESITKVME